MNLRDMIKGASGGIVGITLDYCDTHAEELVKVYMIGLLLKAFDQRPKMPPLRKVRIARMLVSVAHELHDKYTKDAEDAEKTPVGGT